MNILFVIKALAAGPGGGAERILAAVSTALAERGHDVSVLTFDPLESEDFYRTSQSVRRIRIGMGATRKRSGLLATILRIRQIRKTAKVLRPDIAVGFMHSAFIPLGIALAGTGVPVIGSERTSYRHYETRPLHRWLLRASLPFLARLTVNNAGVRAAFPDWISGRMTVIPNPVSPARKLANPVGRGRKILLSVGGLRPEKDHATLIAAFARVAPRHPQWRLRIVGGGALRRSLEKQASRLGAASRIEFAGTMAEVEQEYRSAQLFVLPSIYEAFPNCLAEALAHGLPAVGFAGCPGTNELIVPGVNGVLVEGQDRARALAAALDELMGSPETRRQFGSAAPGTVARYSLDRIIGQWEDLFRSLANTRGSRRKTG